MRSTQTTGAHQGQSWRFPLAVLAGCGVCTAVLLFLMAPRVPQGLGLEIKAGVAARNIQDPDARIRKYLEVHYGDLSDAKNREKAFLDFFNVEHVDALRWLMKHTPEQHRDPNVQAMARWVASYRNGLAPEERESLRRRLQTGEGREMLKKATAQYNSQDVAYRGQTAVVISELLKTISTVQSE